MKFCYEKCVIFFVFYIPHCILYFLPWNCFSSFRNGFHICYHKRTMNHWFIKIMVWLNCQKRQHGIVQMSITQNQGFYPQMIMNNLNEIYTSKLELKKEKGGSIYMFYIHIIFLVIVARREGRGGGRVIHYSPEQIMHAVMKMQTYCHPVVQSKVLLQINILFPSAGALWINGTEGFSPVLIGCRCELRSGFG